MQAQSGSREASLPAFALVFCLGTEHSDANPSEIRANAFALAPSHRAFIFPYGLVGSTIWNVQNCTGPESQEKILHTIRGCDGHVGCFRVKGRVSPRPPHTCLPRNLLRNCMNAHEENFSRSVIF